MSHPFFIEIENYPELSHCIRFDIQELPDPHKPASIKAIVLGADPTNDGVPESRGLKNLKKVFGIDENIYESRFFGLQQINLAAINLTKENVYVQNICRNYFTLQTNDNKQWYKVAFFWLKYLKEELKYISSSTPVLATCEEVFTLLTKRRKPFLDIYRMQCKLPFFSEDLQRNVLPLFRGRAYVLREGKWTDYKNYLRNYFS